MRKANIYIHSSLSGSLTEDENGYHFHYSEKFLDSKQAEAVSATLPLQKEPFHSNVLFSFFDGLIPEGWLLDIAGKSWKIDPRDRMGLLLTVCRDCIGAVSVVPIEEVAL